MNETEFQSRTEDVTTAASRQQAMCVAVCPFREGPETLDLLLAELDLNESALFDAALDLRSLMAARTDAAAALAQLCRLRALLDGRHYLAFYRVRCWVRRWIRAEVRRWRGEPWLVVEAPFGCNRYDEFVNACLAVLGNEHDGWPETATVRFRFVEEVQAPAPTPVLVS